MKYLTVKIIPNASKSEWRECMANGVQKIAIAAPAKKGKANKELIAFLKKEKEVDAKIVSGENTRLKLLLIE